MNLLQIIKQKISGYVIRKASAGKMIDIIEVRTREIGLTSVTTETDLQIRNTFFLPITILSIQTDLLNRDGLKIGRMNYAFPKKIKGNSEEILTTTSQISIITSLFQALSTLLSQHIKMRSVGVAQIRFLWWTFEIPVDDFFEIHPSKLKITKPETEEERLLRMKKEAAWKEKYAAEKEQRKQERALEKEAMLKRRYKENYVPKAEREKHKQAEPLVLQEGQDVQPEPYRADAEHPVQVILEEEVIQQLAEERKEETTKGEAES